MRVRRVRVVPVVVALALAVGCGRPSRPPTTLRFVDATAKAGLVRTTATYALAAADFDLDDRIDLFVSNHLEPPALFRNLGDGRFADVTLTAGPFAPGDLHGASWLDYDQDGLPDLFVSVGADQGRGVGPKRLYRNVDGRRFVPVEVGEPVLDPRGRGRSGCPVDLDGDGTLELLLLNFQPGGPSRCARWDGTAFEDCGDAFDVSRLDAGTLTAMHLDGGPPVLVASDARIYRRGDDGRLRDVARRLGIPDHDLAQAVALGDYDNDGDLDLYVVYGAMQPGAKVVGDAIVHELTFRQHRRYAIRFKAEGAVRLDLIHRGPAMPDRRDAGWLALGSARVPADAMPWEASVSDPRLAGDPAVDRRADRGVFLWRDADGVFELASVGRLHPGSVRGTIRATGRLELVEPLVTEGRADDLRSRLYENRNGTFVDVTANAGVGGPGPGRAAVFADLDDDGDLDLYVVNGGDIQRNSPDVLYRNEGNGTFSDVTVEAGLGGPEDGTGDAVVAFDYDADGDLDLMTTNGHGHAPYSPGPYRLWENRSTTGGRVAVTLSGPATNRLAFGTRIRAQTPVGPLLQERAACTGPYATSVLPIHVGLGAAAETSLVVTWPSGARTETTARAGDTIRLVDPGTVGGS